MIAVTEQNTPDTPRQKAPSDGPSLAVRILAAKVAVAASKKTGRPVDPRVQKLAEMDERS